MTAVNATITTPAPVIDHGTRCLSTNLSFAGRGRTTGGFGWPELFTAPTFLGTGRASSINAGNHSVGERVADRLSQPSRRSVYIRDRSVWATPRAASHWIGSTFVPSGFVVSKCR